MKKIGGPSEWKTNILCNEIKAIKTKIVNAKIKILKLGTKGFGYHTMCGVHSIKHFSVNHSNIYCASHGFIFLLFYIIFFIFFYFFIF